MATKKADEGGSSKIFVTLPQGARALFDQVVEQKIYGSTAGAVAGYLITQRLDELLEKGRIKPP